MNGAQFFDDYRAVSTTLSYSLNLAIAAILVSGLLFAAGSTVQDQRQVTAREELRVIGQRLAAGLQEADRLARMGSETELQLDLTAPRTVAGLQYTVELNPDSEKVILRTQEPDLVVRIPVSVDSGLAESQARGGPIYITVTDDGDLRIGVIS